MPVVGVWALVRAMVAGGWGGWKDLFESKQGQVGRIRDSGEEG